MSEVPALVPCSSPRTPSSGRSPASMSRSSRSDAVSIAVTTSTGLDFVAATRTVERRPSRMSAPAARARRSAVVMPTSCPTPDRPGAARRHTERVPRSRSIEVARSSLTIPGGHMGELELVGLHEDGEHLVLSAADGQKYRLRIDEPLRAAVRRDRPQLEKLRVEQAGALPPREIQARIRAGATAQTLADETGLPIEHVRRFEGAVLDERAFVEHR